MLNRCAGVPGRGQGAGERGAGSGEEVAGGQERENILETKVSNCNLYSIPVSTSTFVFPRCWRSRSSEQRGGERGGGRRRMSNERGNEGYPERTLNIRAIFIH